MLAAQPFGERWLEGLLARARTMKSSELGLHCNQHPSAHSVCLNAVRLNGQRSRAPWALLQSTILRKAANIEKIAFQGNRFHQLGSSAFLQVVELPCGEPVVKEILREAELRSGLDFDPSLFDRCPGVMPGYSTNDHTIVARTAVEPNCFEEDEKLTILEAIETAGATAALIGACWAVHVMAAFCV